MTAKEQESKGISRRQAIKYGAAAVVVAAAAAGGGYYYGTMLAPRATPTTSKTVKMLIPCPLTGSWAVAGAQNRAGAELAISQINSGVYTVNGPGIASLGNALIDATVLDCTSDPSTASPLVRASIDKNQVDLVNGGGVTDPISDAVATANEGAKVPAGLQITFTEPASVKLDYAFSVIPLWDLYVGSGVIDFMQTFAPDAKTLGLAYDDTMISTTIYKVAMDYAKTKGIDVGQPQVFPIGTLTADKALSIVSGLKTSNVDAIVLDSLAANEQIILARALMQTSWAPKFIISDLGAAPPSVYASGAAEAGEFHTGYGAVSTDANISWSRGGQDGSNIKVAEQYMAKFGEEMATQAMITYVATWIHYEVLELAGQKNPNLLDMSLENRREAIKSAFSELKITPDSQTPAKGYPYQYISFDMTAPVHYLNPPPGGFTAQYAPFVGFQYCPIKGKLELHTIYPRQIAYPGWTTPSPIFPPWDSPLRVPLNG